MQLPPAYRQQIRLSDMLLLVAGIAIGAAWVRSWWIETRMSPMTSQQWPANAGILELSFVAIVVGSTYAAPIVLLFRNMSPRTRGSVSIGELLWLGPVCLLAVRYVAFKLTQGVGVTSITPLALYYMWMGANVLLSAIAAFVLCVFVYRFFVGRYGRWTDVFGCASCAMNGVFLVFYMIVSPIII